MTVPEHMSRKTPAIISLVGIAALGLTACGVEPVDEAASLPVAGSSPSAAPLPATSVEPAPTTSAELILAENRYELRDLSLVAAFTVSAEEAATIELAKQTVIQGCMNARGQDFVVESLSAKEAVVEEQRRLSVMLFESDDLAIIGYDALLPSTEESSPDALPPANTDEQYFSDLSDCHNVSDARLGTDGEKPGATDIDFVLDLEIALNKAMFDFVAPQRLAWEECMERNGVPGATALEIPKQVRSGEMSSVKVALSDRDCRNESGLTEAILSFRSAEVARLVSENATLFESVAAIQDTEIQTAVDVLANS